MTDEQAPDAPLPNEPAPVAPAQDQAQAPEPSYQPRPVIEDLLMTVQRGLQIVQSEEPRRQKPVERKHEEKAEE